MAFPERGQDKIVRLMKLDLDMIAAGPSVPHPDTPLGKERTGSVLNALRTIALIRLTNPRANIPATSALSSVGPDARQRPLVCGANVLMPSVTPEEVRGHYAIYPGKNAGPSIVTEHVAQCKRMIKAAGFAPSPAKGFSPRRNHGQSSSRHEARDHYPRTQECR
jgi:biotin synthase